MYYSIMFWRSPCVATRGLLVFIQYDAFPEKHKFSVVGRKCWKVNRQTWRFTGDISSWFTFVAHICLWHFFLILFTFFISYGFFHGSHLEFWHVVVFLLAVENDWQTVQVHENIYEWNSCTYSFKACSMTLILFCKANIRMCNTFYLIEDRCYKSACSSMKHFEFPPYLFTKFRWIRSHYISYIGRHNCRKCLFQKKKNKYEKHLECKISSATILSSAPWHPSLRNRNSLSVRNGGLLVDIPLGCMSEAFRQKSQHSNYCTSFLWMSMMSEKKGILVWLFWVRRFAMKKYNSCVVVKFSKVRFIYFCQMYTLHAKFTPSSYICLQNNLKKNDLVDIFGCMVNWNVLATLSYIQELYHELYC